MWHASNDRLLLLPLLIASAAAGIHVELWRLLSDRWRWLLGRWRGTYMDVRHMDTIMQQWAGISEEEEAKQQQKQQQAAGEIDGKERVVQVRW
jgi:hypothetical protein